MKKSEMCIIFGFNFTFEPKWVAVVLTKVTDAHVVTVGTGADVVVVDDFDSLKDFY